jgi:glutamate-ammonia-ligase adenylyltransferase
MRGNRNGSRLPAEIVKRTCHWSPLMEAASQPPGPIDDDFQWLEESRFRDPERARQQIELIWKCGANPHLLDLLRKRLLSQFAQLDDLDAAVRNLSGFIAASSDPASLLAVFERDPESLPALLQVFATSQSLANRLISDPRSFDLLRAGEHRPRDRQSLVDELDAELGGLQQAGRAALAIRKFYSRELMRVAYAEFVRGLSPEKVGRQLAAVADAVIEAGLRFVLRRLSQRRGMPQRPDGTTPEIAVIALGNLGGEELGYTSPLQLIFIYDSIDHKNSWHRDFYSALVADLVSLLRGDESRLQGLNIDLREGPRHEVGIHICSFREAIQIYETSGRTWQRLSFVKARVVAGSANLGHALLGRLEPWVYRQLISRVDLAEIRMLRHKLEKRAESQAVSSEDVSRAPGGRDDLELTVQFLQLLHGGNLASVRCRNTYDAIIALERAGCITQQEANLLSENYARLCRLQHQLSVMFDQRGTALPVDPLSRKRLAWQLGIRAADGSGGDLERFEELLADTFAKNRKIINHLMLDAPGDGEAVAVETELLLDPDPDPTLVEATMLSHGLTHPKRAMEDLLTLSTETVPFLSPHRCRHFFSSIAPALLQQVARTPNPDATLSSLVQVTDSLGAKATLWELLGSSAPTMELMVRLCATTPYLSGILTNNPGMVDELIDSLLMNRLPSAQRLDAHSIELCRGAADIERILHSFKNSAHLNIGVRDMLGKETLEATHQAIGDTAEACLRRMIEHEQSILSEQFGDPVDAEGEPAELIVLGLGKLGGREPNYHSDLDAIFLYSADGETRRRMGGHRATLTNQLFFNQLTQRVISRINHSGPAGRLYELDSRLRDSGEEGVWAMSVGSFLQRFDQAAASLWQRLALCKARSISGSRPLRHRTDAAVAKVIVDTQWEPAMAAHIRQLRERMQQTARAGNLKRGQGGTVDVEYVAQMLTLRHARQSPEIIQQGTTACLAALARAGHLDERQSLALIHGYRTLRRIEASLRLMNTPARHELPEDPDAMRNLAFLMNESDPAMIVAQCQQSRLSNRAVFDQVFEQASQQ